MLSTPEYARVHSVEYAIRKELVLRHTSPLCVRLHLEQIIIKFFLCFQAISIIIFKIKSPNVGKILNLLILPLMVRSHGTKIYSPALFHSALKNNRKNFQMKGNAC